MVKSQKPHRQLILWQKSISFSVFVYKLSENFPSTEKYGLISQFRRASVSIALNIAEGAGRNHTKEFIQFLGIANGSISEVDTICELLFQLNFINLKQQEELSEKINELSALNNGLLRKLKSS